MPRHFLRDDDVTPAEQREILNLALEMKQDRFKYKTFAGPQTVAVIFDKTSTRTRVSFAVGIADLGGVPLIIDSQVSQMGKKESVADTARVLDRQVAQIVWRTFSHAGLEEMAANSNVPVINSLSDSFHPCQLLADLLTVREEFGKTEGLKLAYIGDAANNMGNSYLLAATLAGMSASISAPVGFTPDPGIVRKASEIAETQGQKIQITNDPREAARDSHVIATDTWVSMGMESEKEERLTKFSGFTVGQELMQLARPEAIFLHCLPAYRGYEVSAEVIDGPQSRVWQEAENRLHAQKALMHWLAAQN